MRGRYWYFTLPFDGGPFEVATGIIVVVSTAEYRMTSSNLSFGYPFLSFSNPAVSQLGAAG
jgi:hypothetical protein